MSAESSRVPIQTGPRALTAAGRERAQDARTGGDSAAARIRHQARWVDLQIQQAMARGEFDNLPGPASRWATWGRRTTGTGG